jgi:hypothetical protein
VRIIELRFGHRAVARPGGRGQRSGARPATSIRRWSALQVARTFMPEAHEGEIAELPPQELNAEFPYTLDLRRNNRP